MADEQGPICVSVINMKGGVGKTTVSAMLARYFSLAFKQDVLAIDLDPQANLSQALMGEYGYKNFLENKSPSIVEIFKGYQPPTSLNPSSGPLDVRNVVHEITSNLQVIPSRFDFSDNLISSIGTDPRVLARLIANSFHNKDLIIIDCAPTESILTQTAYHASGYVLVPVKPEFFATIGFPLLNDSLNAFRNSNSGHQIDVVGIVINNSFYDGGNDGGPEKERSMKEISEEADKNDWHVFENQLVHSRGFPKIMRGDFSYSGNSLKSFHPFATEFATRLVHAGWIPTGIGGK